MIDYKEHFEKCLNDPKQKVLMEAPLLENLDTFFDQVKSPKDHHSLVMLPALPGAWWFIEKVWPKAQRVCFLAEVDACIVYFGPNPNAFKAAFSCFGPVCVHC